MRTRQANRARLSVRGAAMEKIPRREFDLEPRQGRCSAGPAFGRAEAAHPRPEPVDPCSTPDGHTAGLPCARRIETRSAVCAKPARKHGADVRGRAGACCRIACGSGVWQRPREPELRARALRFFSGRCSSGCAATMGDRGRMPALRALGTRKLLVAFGRHTCAQRACTHTGALCMRPGCIVAMATAASGLPKGMNECGESLPRHLSTQQTSTVVRPEMCCAASASHARVHYAHDENSTQR